MRNLISMLWVEQRKAWRARLPHWTAVGSLFMPLGLAFLIFVAQNPELSRQLGLVSAKADLLALGAVDWASYLSMYAQLIALAGFMLFVLIIAWVFGREFADGTLKDLLAVPMPRGTLLLAKFILVAVWSAALTALIVLAGLVIGAVISLPGGSAAVLAAGVARVAAAATLTIIAVTPFALFASTGRGYLLPMGLALLTVMLTNLVVIAGWGDYFPWAVATQYAQGNPALPAGVISVLATGAAGMAATYAWWKLADQNR
jgi:ABC-2 type transport system permease protein